MQRIAKMIAVLFAAASAAFAQIGPTPTPVPAPVATVKVQTPGPILHATVPLPKGYAWNAHASPFTVADAAGRRWPTQWEAVTRWPGTADIRVAEVFAAVPLATGPQTYTLQVEPDTDARTIPGEWAKRWLAAAPTFLIDGQQVQAKAVGASVRFGQVATTTRFYAPHLLGWVTVYAGLDVADLILIAHNGEPRTPVWFFDSLELEGAAHWETFAPEPTMPASGSGRSVTLVAPRADGKANWIEQRGWRRWHLVIHDGTPASQLVARAMAQGAGWGVADAWTRVGAYQAHALPLPTLTGVQLGQAAKKCRDDWAGIQGALASGAPFGMGATAATGAGRIGFRHAWSQFYGGVTGGAYRFQWAGLEAALTGETHGLLELDARFRMVADRMPVILCDARGAPQRYEAWLTSSGAAKGGWRISAADGRFDNDGGAAGLGWSTATSNVPANRIPTADVALLAKYLPIDWQHHDRAHQVAVSLVWLNGDPSAKWAVQQYAELWRWRERGRLQGALAKARSAPGTGTFDIGREDGHGFTVAADAYALGNATWQGRFRPILSDYVSLLSAAQMPNGLWQLLTNKNAQKPPFGTSGRPLWCVAKGTEEALNDGALMAIRGCAPEFKDAIDPMLERHALAGLWRYSWNSGAVGAAPTDYVGVRPIAWSGTTASYGTPHSDPATAPRLNADGTEIPCSLAYAAWIQKQRDGAISADLWSAIEKSCGNAANPLAWMQSRTLYQLQIDDFAPLMAALQAP